jgi:hypothetical protein
MRGLLGGGQGRATYTSRVCAVALVAVRAFADDLAVNVPALGTVSGYRLCEWYRGIPSMGTYCVESWPMLPWPVRGGGC